MARIDEDVEISYLIEADIVERPLVSSYHQVELTNPERSFHSNSRPHGCGEHENFLSATRVSQLQGMAQHQQASTRPDTLLSAASHVCAYAMGSPANRTPTLSAEPLLGHEKPTARNHSGQEGETAVVQPASNEKMAGSQNSTEAGFSVNVTTLVGNDGRLNGNEPECAPAALPRHSNCSEILCDITDPKGDCIVANALDLPKPLDEALVLANFTAMFQTRLPNEHTSTGGSRYHIAQHPPSSTGDISPAMSGRRASVSNCAGGDAARSGHMQAPGKQRRYVHNQLRVLVLHVCACPCRMASDKIQNE
jgi:hypothetical protein